MPVNLSNHRDAGLAALYDAFVREVGTYIRLNRPYWGGKLGIDSGTLANLEQGASYILTFGNTSLATGCVSLQAKTEEVLRSVGGGSSWQVMPVRVGSAAMGHSAVAVYPSGKAMKDGYIFDAWISQSPQAYTFAEWENNFRLMSVLGKARRQ